MVLFLCEVEVVVNIYVFKEVVWLSLFLDEVRYEYKVIFMKSDNISVLDLIKKILFIMLGLNILIFSIILLC